METRLYNMEMTPPLRADALARLAPGPSLTATHGQYAQ
jgi:hypothetical protein